MDTATADIFSPSSRQHVVRRSFTPRFDVRELGGSYELKGEIPGIEQKDLEIEFVDERTLVIRGRTASETSDSNVKAEAAAEKEEATAAAEGDNVSEKSANYQKPSVEEDGYVDAAAETSAEGAKTPSSAGTVAANEQSASSTTVESKKAEAEVAEPNYKYWVSERSVGEFERRFSFPGRVDQEAVKASLKNGILSVVVPKIVAREARRIVIE